MLNGLNQVTGFEQNLNGVNNVNMHYMHYNFFLNGLIFFF